MSNMDILILKDEMDLVMNESNKDDLDLLIEEFKRGHFPNVLSKSNKFREKYHANELLCNTLLLIEAVSHAQIGEFERTTEIISKLYKELEDAPSEKLTLLGELAFMSDYKLTRRIMTDAIKFMENESDPDQIKLARSYLVLGEAEENLDKLKRAIKYYKVGLSYFEENDERDKYMILFLHFKIGMIYSRLNKSDEAIEYLDKTIMLSSIEDEHMKINSLVSIAKIYGSKDENEKAFPYLEKAIPMFEESAFINTLVHAEALTEMAFYYFDQSMLDEAVPHYDRAIEIYLKQSNKSPRKLGMIYMQYAYCLEHQKKPNNSRASKNYENAIEQLEKTNDQELLVNALSDTIAFFDHIKDTRKKRLFENKLLELANE